MELQFNGSVAFVTGASSGIGKAVALQFLEAGVQVAVCSRDREELDETFREVADPHRVLKIQMDVSDEDQVVAGIRQIEERWGRLDYVLANAGINGVWAPIDEISSEDWDKTIGINLRGTFLTVKYAVPLLKKQGGAIVIISSVNGTRMFSNTGATAYATSKAAQVAFGKMLAGELAEDGIRVNIICPGAIETEIEESTKKMDLEQFEKRVEYPEGVIPLTHGKPGSADDVADAVLFLCSEKSRHITGTELWIDGAQSLLQG